ncbi:hypothetical protein [Streptomyces mirabilis]|uniref:hypothetical protein n=1 Tax=Streptomyces mirabilis TaxID=68239 RepID=UPI0021BFA366|nr:hypothetical protein [Streptomyces mirabilis]MCT9107586.1 hypothetical protein [Streptomyces mirabilis]
MDALGHAINVANTLGRYVPDAPPQVVAACLLHAIPQWPMVDEAVHELVEAECGVEARWLVEAMRAEEAVLAHPSEGAVQGQLRRLRTIPWLAHATLAFKIVTLQYTVAHAAHRRWDAAQAWPPPASHDERPPYLHQLLALATEVVHPVMTNAFARLLDKRPSVTVCAASR